MGNRTWVKLYCDSWITGTLRQETPVFRGLWADLLALVGSGQHGDKGILELQNGVGYLDEQIATILQIPLTLWHQNKQRMIETERIRVTPQNSITILNWSKYQSEYTRTKQYKNKERSLNSKEIKNKSKKEIENKIESEYSENMCCTKNTENGTTHVKGDLISF
jgi:hypothetical protein